MTPRRLGRFTLMLGLAVAPASATPSAVAAPPEAAVEAALAAYARNLTSMDARAIAATFASFAVQWSRRPSGEWLILRLMMQPVKP
ncbi:MAG: hypothetical protein U0599_30720 [Vicinamibacteria bacterium]